MRNFNQSITAFATRLTVLSWVLIVIVMSGLVYGGVYIANSIGKTKPVIGSTGLAENIDELPPVKEGEDKTGEILPPSETPASAQADITQDDFSYPE